jgi:hypothetical protein
VCAVAAGVPLKPMLAKICEGIPDAIAQLRDHGGRFLAEFKYDGVRAQIHLLPDSTVSSFFYVPNDMHQLSMVCVQVRRRARADPPAAGRHGVLLFVPLQRLSSVMAQQRIVHSYAEARGWESAGQEVPCFQAKSCGCWTVSLLLAVWQNTNTARPSSCLFCFCRSRCSAATARTAAATSPTSPTPSAPPPQVAPPAIRTSVFTCQKQRCCLCLTS